MAEAQMVCTRLGVLRNGRISYDGSHVAMRQSYGPQYFLRMVVHQLEPDRVTALIAQVEDLFPECQSSCLAALLNFTIPRDTDVNWDTVFCFLDQVASDFSVNEFSIGLATVDDCFEQCLMTPDIHTLSEEGLFPASLTHLDTAGSFPLTEGTTESKLYAH